MTDPTRHDGDPARPSAERTPTRTIVALCAILLLGAGLRLYGLARYSIWYDEGATMYIAGFTPTPSRLLDPEWGTEPPLLPVLTFCWTALLRLAGASLEPGTWATDFLLRLIPCACSIACIPLTFAVARRLTGTAAPALAASFLVAISPLHVYYAQELRPYASMTFLALGAWWCMLRALDEDRLRHWAGMTILLALSMYNHFFSVWNIAAFNLCFLVSYAMRRRHLTRWTISQTAVIALSWPAIRQGLFINEIVSRADTSWYPPLTNRAALITIKNFFAGYDPNPTLYYPLFLLGAGFAILGLHALRRRPESALTLLVLVAAPILGNVIVWQQRAFSYYEHRLFVFSAIALAVLAGAGICALPRRGMVCAAGVLIAGLTMPCLADHYAQRLHPSLAHRLGARVKAANRDVANHIREGMRPGDVVGHYSHVTLFPMRDHYLPDLPHYTLGFTDGDREALTESWPHRSVWEHAGALAARVDAVAAGAERMWYIESWWEPEDRPSSVYLYNGWLNAHAWLVERKEFAGVSLCLYDIEAFNRVRPRVAQIADFERESVPEYVPHDGARQADQPELNRSPKRLSETTALGKEAVPGFALVRGEQKSAPGDSAGIRIEFAAPPGPLECRLYECAEAIPPIAFRRADPATSAWFPVLHQNPAFLDTTDRIKMARTVAGNDRGDDALHADVILDPGDYQVFAYVWREVAPVNTSRAALDFSFTSDSTPPSAAGSPLLATEIVPHGTSGSSGWVWQPLGRLTGGGRVHIKVSARTPAGLERAHADLGRVVFVFDTDAVAGAEYGPSRTLRITAGASEPATAELDGADYVTRCRQDVFARMVDRLDIRLVSRYIQKEPASPQ